MFDDRDDRRDDSVRGRSLLVGLVSLGIGQLTFNLTPSAGMSGRCPGPS